MTKSKNENHEDDEAVIMERMNDALKRAMNSKPETHGEMVRRRRDNQTNRREAPKGKNRP